MEENKLTKDMLSDMFSRQKEFNDYLNEHSNETDKYTRDEWLGKYALALNVELCEFISETNYKWWKKPKQENMDAMKEELIDIFHFLLCMCLKCGMTAEEFYDFYVKKITENMNRQLGLSDKKGYV